MATKVTKNIGKQVDMPSGVTTDFADINLFDNWLNTQDLVAQDIWIDAVVHSNQTDAMVSNTLMAPATFDDDHYVIVRPEDSKNVNKLNTTGALDYGTEGIEMVMNPGGTPRMRVGVGVWVQDFRITVNNTTSTSYGQCGIEVGRGPNTGPEGFGGLRRCRIKSLVASTYNSAIELGEGNSNGTIQDCLLIQESGGSPFIFVAPNSEGVKRCTFIRRGGSPATPAITSVNVNGNKIAIKAQDNAFIGCGNKPIESLAASNFYTNNYTDTPVNTPTEGIVYASPLIQGVNDARPAAGSPLIGGASSAAVSQEDIRSNNRGATPDAGAVQLTAAPPKPSGTFDTFSASGTTVSIGGTTTGTPTSGTVALKPSNATNNPAVAQGPKAITLGSGKFSSTFSDVPPGEYYAEVTLRNTGGSSTLVSSTYATIQGSTGSITSQSVDGQTLNITGTAGNGAISGTIIVPAAANNPMGAVTQQAEFAINNGAFSISMPVLAGNYDAPLVQLVSATGSGMPLAGTAPLSILSISGNPEGPMIDATVAPDAPINVVAVAGSNKATVSFTPASSGPVANEYLVVASSGETQNGDVSPIVIAVPNGVPVSFKVRAINNVGSSPDSVASNTVTPSASLPSAPQNVHITPGNASVTVTFDPPKDNGGNAIIDYSITASSGAMKTVTSSPTTIDVPNGVDVTVTVRARNSVGMGPASAPSNKARAGTVPSAPQNVEFTVANGKVTATFTAPTNDGGWPVLGYRIKASTGQIDTGSASPVVLEMPNEVSATFTVLAYNAIGDGEPSEVSAPLTPKWPEVRLKLVDSMNNPVANLGGIKVAWFDEATPDLFNAPTFKTASASTNANGDMELVLVGSALNSKQTGWINVTNSDGLGTTVHKAFSGPVEVE